MVDNRALKILFDRYWTSAGWRPEAERRTTPTDFEYAKRAGVMFDPLAVTHDDVIARLSSHIGYVSVAAVADAFVASLSTRQLDLRSALGSYAVFRHLPLHRPDDQRHCETCGFYAEGANDLNVFSFERHKWGGVRHDDACYAAFDLDQFARHPRALATPDAVAILRSIIEALRDAPPITTAATVEKCLAPIARSNKSERDVIVATLGFCGILRTPGHPSYRTEFVPVRSRELPDRRFVDMRYPACWWRAADGLDEHAIREYFGHLL